MPFFGRNWLGCPWWVGNGVEGVGWLGGIVGKIGDFLEVFDFLGRLGWLGKFVILGEIILEVFDLVEKFGIFGRGRRFLIVGRMMRVQTWRNVEFGIYFAKGFDLARCLADSDLKNCGRFR